MIQIGPVTLVDSKGKAAGELVASVTISVPSCQQDRNSGTSADALTVLGQDRGHQSPLRDLMSRPGMFRFPADSTGPMSPPAQALSEIHVLSQVTF